MTLGKALRFARTVACVAFAATLVALPSAYATDRDDDRGRSHHHDGDGHGNPHDLAAELAELKERVSKLEGHLTREDVIGTYIFRSLQASLITGSTPQVGRLEHMSATAVLQLNANGTFSLSGRETGFNAIWSFPTNRERVDKAASENGTWTYIGGVLRLTFGAEVVPFGGAVGGRMFLWTGSNPADGSTTLALLVRTNQ